MDSDMCNRYLVLREPGYQHVLWSAVIREMGPFSGRESASQGPKEC